jgi:dephospho-CoA kinase
MDDSNFNQRLIGLTGGIATGKSTVAAYLHDRHNIPILDADSYAREAVEIHSPILTAIADRYGAEILHSDGSLKRGPLGEIIFNHPGERAWVESQIHPYVKRGFQQALSALRAAPIVVLMIPLLFEAQLTAWVTEIWVVACDPATQLTRLMVRNGLTKTQALARINSQMPLAVKVDRADVVLVNDHTREHLHEQIDQALRK